MDLRLILHPTTLETATQPALTVTLSLARRYSCRVLILLVEPVSRWANKVTYGNNPPQPITHFRQGEAELRDHLAEVAPDVDVDVAFTHAERTDQVVQTAVDSGCDLIVMEHQDKGWLSRWGSRSLPDKLVKVAPCPVLLVNPRHPSPPLVEATIQDDFRRKSR